MLRLDFLIYASIKCNFNYHYYYFSNCYDYFHYKKVLFAPFYILQVRMQRDREADYENRINHCEIEIIRLSKVAFEMHRGKQYDDLLEYTPSNVPCPDMT